MLWLLLWPLLRAVPVSLNCVADGCGRCCRGWLQMPKKSKDSPENQSPPTVLDGLPEDLIQGGSTFGVLC